MVYSVVRISKIAANLQPLLCGHPSYVARKALQKGWPHNRGFTVYVSLKHWAIIMNFAE